MDEQVEAELKTVACAEWATLRMRHDAVAAQRSEAFRRADSPHPGREARAASGRGQLTALEPTGKYSRTRLSTVTT